MRSKAGIAVCFFLILSCFFFELKACTPLATPNLLSQSFSGNSLLLNWQSVNMMTGCNGYSVQVEIVPVNSAFTGTTFFYSPNLNKTLSPEAYPQQTISISTTVCAGTVYQFRARETDGAVLSAWTSVYTFTVPPVLPVLNVAPLTNSYNVICTNQPVQLNVSVVQGQGPASYAYSWQPTTGLSCTNCANPVTTASNSTSYTCTVSNPCWTSSRQMNMMAPPVVQLASTSSVICAGETATLTANGASGYTWSTGNTGNFIAVTLQATTVYTVVGRMSGCIGTATIMQQVDVCSGTDALSPGDQPVTIYPNPNSGSFVIGTQGAITLDVMNEQGQRIRKLFINNDSCEVSMDGLSPGIYFLIGTSKDQAVCRKLIHVLK
jgi:hypothetical protein